MKAILRRYGLPALIIAALYAGNRLLFIPHTAGLLHRLLAWHFADFLAGGLMLCVLDCTGTIRTAAGAACCFCFRIFPPLRRLLGAGHAPVPRPLYRGLAGRGRCVSGRADHVCHTETNEIKQRTAAAMRLLYFNNFFRSFQSGRYCSSRA